LNNNVAGEPISLYVSYELPEGTNLLICSFIPIIRQYLIVLGRVFSESTED
jgi:hypothetical protein